MKNLESSPFLYRAKKLLHLACCHGVAAVSLFALASASAASFYSDFNSGLPAGTAVYGWATNDTSGGVSNSGCIKLVPTTSGAQGSFVITNDLDSGQPVVGFVAQFKAFVGGGTGADGFSFVFSPDLLNANGNFAETGYGSGLTISFDTYSNELDHVGIDVWWAGSEYYPSYFTGIRADAWVDVLVQLTPDGYVQVMYDGNWIFTNTAPLGPTTITGGRFGFGARSGGLTDNHWIDDLRITTYTSAHPYVASYLPAGRNVRADAPISVVLTDSSTQVDPTKIVLLLDGTPVTPTITQASPNTTIRYVPATPFASASVHNVSLSFADNSSPTPFTNNFQFSYSISTFGTLAANLAADPSFVNQTAPGFFMRFSQIADLGSRDVARAELQLANLLVDGSTGLPFANLAAPNPTDSTFTLANSGVINYALPAGGATGNFPGDLDFPGLPGPTLSTGDSYALDAVTYLYLTPGFYSLGVNSSDGFKLTVADGADVFATQEGIYNGVRASADSIVSFVVEQVGYYPFRLVYFVGDSTYGPAPGSTAPDLEFFSVDREGNKTLINDTAVSGYLRAYRPAKTKPYVRAVSPAIGDSGVPGNAAVSATLVDGSLTVQTGSIALTVNGTTVSPTVSKNGGVSTVSYQPTTAFAPSSSNYVTLAFTDSDGNRRTNGWSFTVANIMTAIWSIPAVNNTWVTAGSTERGLAYNPKTGHLILISRAASPAPANGLGMAILDSNTGAVLGTMNIGDIATTGLGVFKLSMVGVAEDGVIYACNLTTSGSVPFRIYRWADESAAPQLVYEANPIGGATRCGDAFRVRGAGAGTQIIANGNSAVTTSPIFTTVDGTNFTGTALSITGISANSLRLGLAFGCGNTFYGETTSTPVSYIGFAGAPSTTASLLAAYGIYDNAGSNAIGPIAVDIPNQRLIGNSTIAPHSITVYDLSSLATTPTKNFPLDQRTYASQNTSFGTGSVDFTPDGSRVFCLDTGNGIIAFSLTAKPAAPVICAQPRDFFSDPTNRVGFMDVMAVGSPQSYQWRFNGAKLTGATNRTVNLSNVQQAQLGYYSVVITNPLGSVTSAPALLDIAMVITNQPASQVINNGDPLSLNVGVDGGAYPLKYQWKLNDVNIAGATGTSYSVASATLANGGLYTMVVTDAYTQTVTSVTAMVNVLTTSTPGSGTGLTGDYYTNATYTTSTPPDPFSGLPALSRVDPVINFDWGTTGSPDPSIPADYFSVRWHGKVQPLYSGTYTFYTRSDDGSRLWVNGQLVIGNSWVAQGPTERSGNVTGLVANQKYDLVLEYYEKTGGAVCDLSWFSSGQIKAIIPTEQLYPASGPLVPNVTVKLSGNNLVLNWVGTGSIYSATNLSGPWSLLVSGVAGPYSIPVGTAPQTFYRVVAEQAN